MAKLASRSDGTSIGTDSIRRELANASFHCTECVANAICLRLLQQGAIFGRGVPSIRFLPVSLMFPGGCMKTYAAIQLIRESTLLLSVIDNAINHRYKTP